MNHTTKWTIPHHHPAFAGHFEGMPILPGVVLIDKVTQIMAEANQLDLAQYQINSIKFLSPARPGDELTIEYAVSEKGMLHFNILTSDRKIATGSIHSTTEI